MTTPKRRARPHSDHPEYVNACRRSPFVSFYNIDTKAPFIIKSARIPKKERPPPLPSHAARTAAGDNRIVLSFNEKDRP